MKYHPFFMKSRLSYLVRLKQAMWRGFQRNKQSRKYMFPSYTFSYLLQFRLIFKIYKKQKQRKKKTLMLHTQTHTTLALGALYDNDLG